MTRTRTSLAAATAAAAAAVLGLAACGSSTGSTQASAAPKSHTLSLSFLQDPGNGAADPAIYYAGQGIILQTGARRSTQEIIDAFAALSTGRALTATGATR